MDLINIFKLKNQEEINKSLQKFLVVNVNTFVFSNYNLETQKGLWLSLVDLLNNAVLHDCHLQAIQALKLLSRDKRYLNEIIDDCVISTLLNHANLNHKSDNLNKATEAAEAQKCLYNLIINNPECRTLLLDQFVLEAIIIRLSKRSISDENKLFNLKILFLLSAHCLHCLPRLRHTLKGVNHMMNLLEDYANNDLEKMNDAEMRCASEVLKILYNMLHTNVQQETGSIPEISSDLSAEQNEPEESARLILLIIKYLIAEIPLDKHYELRSHAVTVLSVINPDYYVHLHRPRNVHSLGVTTTDDNGQEDMSTTELLLQFLESRLDFPNQDLMEKLSPVLLVLITYSRQYRNVRKYLRGRVLPPLRDVSRRPETGNTLRNKLCKLMTCPVTHIELLVAQFLFILCKENVRRLIKYTGYGNAAGLLANRGLMHGHQSGQALAGYSSDDEDSDTEEYMKVEDKLNPVTGCYEPSRPNPAAAMTEEQKEYEAVQLINIIDRLQRQGIIQPARIGEDGRPHAVGHVLELQEEIGLPKYTPEENTSKK